MEIYAKWKRMLRKNADKQKYITHECDNLLNMNITYLSVLGSDHVSVCISVSFHVSWLCNYLMTKSVASAETQEFLFPPFRGTL